MKGAGHTNALRDGMVGDCAARRANETAHPVQELQHNFLRTKLDAKTRDLGNMFGSHMMMRRKMEEAILSRHQRLPGLKSEFVGLSTLLGRDDDFGFEDVLDDPWMRETSCMPLHDAMEIKLFGKAL
eukprot:TRINITY_DN1329_c0_g1_i2.p2 TRINITY_DN1329_c0_g1~~TRINITY_DN1329_c0_g1_i2.p2  ORF type:complete len:127 (-),score=30.42 TRINITY_DN1329_c0_g1_i2:485-865(-)